MPQGPPLFTIHGACQAILACVDLPVSRSADSPNYGTKPNSANRFCRRSNDDMRSLCVAYILEKVRRH
jgi:hypothetical protein